MDKKQVVIYNFNKLCVETEIDRFEDIDVSKSLGNIIHQSTSDIGIDDVARKIYHTGKVELSEAQKKIILGIVQRSNLIVAIKQAITKLLTK